MISVFELSKRWTYPEHEGMKVGGLGRIDISRWARGATTPIRNEVGPLEHHVQPITSLRRIEAFYENEVHAKPKPVEPFVMPYETPRVRHIGDLDETFKVQSDFWARLGVKGRITGGQAVA